MDACCAVLVGLPPRVHLGGWGLREVEGWLGVGVLVEGLKNRREERVWGLACRACARAFALLGSLWFLIEGD